MRDHDEGRLRCILADSVYVVPNLTPTVFLFSQLVALLSVQQRISLIETITFCEVHTLPI